MLVDLGLDAGTAPLARRQQAPAFRLVRAVARVGVLMCVGVGMSVWMRAHEVVRADDGGGRVRVCGRGAGRMGAGGRVGVEGGRLVRVRIIVECRQAALCTGIGRAGVDNVEVDGVACGASDDCLLALALGRVRFDSFASHRHGWRLFAKLVQERM